MRVVCACVGGALGVTQIEEAMILIQIGLVEEHEQAAEDVEVLDLLVIGDPAVAQALQDEADAVHLAVSAGGAAERPARDRPHGRDRASS